MAGLEKRDLPSLDAVADPDAPLDAPREEIIEDGDASDEADAQDDGEVPPDVLAGASRVSAGASHSCAVLADGRVLCWGGNRDGQLGDGTTTDSAAAVAVPGLTSATSVAAGRFHTCAGLGSGGAACWGRDSDGQLGNGNFTGSVSPVTVSSLDETVSSLSSTSRHACVAAADGGSPRIACWGWNEYGQLGDGSRESRCVPVDVSGTGSAVAGVSAGGGHTCAVDFAGSLRCWGWNFYGQLGDGTVLDKYVATAATLPETALSVACGGRHTCVLLVSGNVMCWGDNDGGQLGSEEVATSSVPIAVGGLPGAASALAAGDGHTCALTASGGVLCWGANDRGQLGDGTTSGRSAPAAVEGLAEAVLGISAGEDHTCALLGTGHVACWGANGSGQLGDGSTQDASVPVLVVVR
jgi:alpha-tubulin suppressor-like RCC1 family protein